MTTQAICTSCNQPDPTSKARPHGSAECDACYRAALAYGHLQVDHDSAVPDCPLCQAERDEDRRIARVLGVPIGNAHRMGR